MPDTVDNTEDNEGFNLLFSYISISNKPQEKIPMTAPVITSQKIPMTAMVISDAGSMSFVMPAGTKRKETPDPLENRLRIVTLPEREIAVIQFSGYAPPEEVDAASSRLQEGVKNSGILMEGRTFLMQYDSPWTPGFLRRNEVAIKIRP